MQLAKTLIDKAKKVCLTDAELAKRINVHPPDISQLRAGTRTLTPELAARIADVAGMDAKQAYIDAAIQRDLEKGSGRLAEILGKALAAGGAAMLLFYFNEPSISAMGKLAIELTMLHIVLSRTAAIEQPSKRHPARNQGAAPPPSLRSPPGGLRPPASRLPPAVIS